MDPKIDFELDKTFCDKMSLLFPPTPRLGIYLTMRAGKMCVGRFRVAELPSWGINARGMETVKNILEKYLKHKNISIQMSGVRTLSLTMSWT